MSRPMVPIWKPEFGKDEKPSIDMAITQAVGAASACWENLAGAGVFQDAHALAVVDGLSCVIHDMIDDPWNELESMIKKQLDFWQEYLDSGITSTERPLAWTRVDTLNGVLKTVEELRPKASE